jgi:hypothetical protein
LLYLRRLVATGVLCCVGRVVAGGWGIVDGEDVGDAQHAGEAEDEQTAIHRRQQ